MLNITADLVSYLRRPAGERDGIVVSALVNAVLSCGGKEDADVSLALFLEHPTTFDYSYLLAVINKFGTEGHAEQLFKAFIRDGHLAKDAPSEILETIGRLRYTPATPLLIRYALGVDTETDYHHSSSAVFGLLNLDCEGYHDIIRREIEKCYGQNLFAEFVPALVSKLPDYQAYMEPLYTLGDQYASTDCNGGIILGFSLCGEAGRPYFNKLLFNPNWETFSGGTGTAHISYMAMKNLGMTFRELYADVRQQREKEGLEYAVKVLFALINERITDYEGGQTESFQDLYHLFFKWKNGYESDNLVDLARQTDRTDEAYQLERLLALKITEEATARC